MNENHKMWTSAESGLHKAFQLLLDENQSIQVYEILRMADTCLEMTKDSVIKEDMKELSKSNEILSSPKYYFKGEITVVFIYLFKRYF